MSAERTGGGAVGPSRARIVAFLERELESPRPFETIARELPDLVGDDRRLGDALAALAEADRKRFWVKSQSLWFSRFGWRLIRPMMATGIVAALAFFVFGGAGAGRDFLYFLLGVAALYVLLQVYAHFWSRRDDRKLAEAEGALRARLEEILREL